MEDFADDEDFFLLDDVWCIILEFSDTADICRFAVADRSAYRVAMGLDLEHVGQLKDGRSAVQERWARARNVLTQVQVVGNMQSLRSARQANPSSLVRRCARVQRLNRHRR